MPPNTCQTRIIKGINSGKLCFQVSKRCRHISKTCLVCNKYFAREDTYNRHTKICDIPVHVHLQSEESDFRAEIKDCIKTLSGSLHNIEHILASGKVQPITNIHNTVIYQHLTISEMGAFKVLCDKMGTAEATNFLCNLAVKPRTMELFEKLYLGCAPVNYPIANNNGKDFYYRDENDNIIHDTDGHIIDKLGERLMKNTFIEAADPLLKRFVKQNEGDHEGDDTDYDRFRELQNGASSFKSDKSFIKDLYPKTYNPTHAFFTGTSKIESS